MHSRQMNTMNNDIQFELNVLNHDAKNAQDNQSFWNINGVELAVRDATSALHIIIKNL